MDASDPCLVAVPAPLGVPAVTPALIGHGAADVAGNRSPWAPYATVRSR